MSPFSASTPSATPGSAGVSQARLFASWAPLASTWLMMGLEGPFVAALVARLDAPKENLAAFGVAYAVAFLAESPVVMMLSAATALVEDGPAFRRLRAFNYTICALLTALLAAALLPTAWNFIGQGLMGLPDEVSSLTRRALLLMLPWPAAIGFRRFWQGVLIRGGQVRRVAYGTVVRLVAMTAAGLAGAIYWDGPGAQVAALSLSVGVLAEAAAARLMASGALRRVKEKEPLPERQLSFGGIFSFYLPLALTSFLSMAAHSVTVFFMGRAPAAIESLAVLPVVNGLVFLFRSLGLAYQEVAISFLAESRERNREAVVTFARRLILAATVAMTLIAFTPLADLWFTEVTGLRQDLASFAQLPLRILFLMPALSVLLSLQRAILVQARRTRPIGVATGIELAGIAGGLLLLIGGFQVVGAVAAAVSFMAGRVLGNLFLLAPARAAIATDDRG